VPASPAATRSASAAISRNDWPKSPKTLPGIETFASDDKLQAFLDGCEILVNLLPLPHPRDRGHPER